MMRPTLRAVLWFAASIPLALLLIAVWPGRWYYSLYFPVGVLAMMAADMSMALSRRRLRGEPVAPVRLFVGQPGQVALTLEGEGQNRPLSITVLLEMDGDVVPPSPVEGIMQKGRLEYALPVVPLRRGRVKIAALWLRWLAPLGLIEMRSRRKVTASIDIVPDVHGIHEEAIRFFARDAEFGVKSQLLRGDGVEFDKLCEYEQGMDNRFIDWKRSARHRKLLCKEFRQERNHQIVLGFDTGHLMLEPIEGMPKLDHAIKAGMTLGWISLHGGDLVGGCGFDARMRSFIQPGRGMPYFTQMQRFAAGLDYHTEETNFTLGLAELNARLRRRALVVVFSDFVDAISAELLTESLQLMTRRHVVIFVTFRDPMLSGRRERSPVDFTDAAEAVLADDFLRERAVVLEKVARLGVHCLEVPARGVSTALLNRYLLIKQRGLL